MTELNREALLKEAKELVDKAMNLYYGKNGKEGEELALKAVEIYEELEDWEEYIKARSITGVCKISFQGNTNFFEVESYLIKTLEFAIFKLGDKHPRTYSATNTLGFWYAQFMENPKKAEPLFKKCLDCIIDMGKQIDYDAVTAYSNLAYVYASMKDFTTAILYGGKAIYILEQAKQTDLPPMLIYEEITQYTNLGAYYAEISAEKKGLYYLNHALQLCNNNEFRGKDNQISNIQFHLSKLYSNQGEYAKAYEFMKKTLANRLKYLPEQDPRIALCYQKMGELQLDMKEYEQAILFVRKGFTILSNFEESHSIALAKNLLVMSRVYLEIQSYEKALESIQKSFTYLLIDFQYQTVYENPETLKSRDNFQFILNYGYKIKILLNYFVSKKQENNVLDSALGGLRIVIQAIDELKKDTKIKSRYCYFWQLQSLLKFLLLDFKFSCWRIKKKKPICFVRKQKPTPC